jgi:hypothetical protein
VGKFEASGFGPERIQSQSQFGAERLSKKTCFGATEHLNGCMHADSVFKQFSEHSLRLVAEHQHRSGAFPACPNFEPFRYGFLRDGAFCAYGVLGSNGAVMERVPTALMESATLWKVDATEAALRAEAGLDRFP